MGYSMEDEIASVNQICEHMEEEGRRILHVIILSRIHELNTKNNPPNADQCPLNVIYHILREKMERKEEIRQMKLEENRQKELNHSLFSEISEWIVHNQRTEFRSFVLRHIRSNSVLSLFTLLVQPITINHIYYTSSVEAMIDYSSLDVLEVVLQIIAMVVMDSSRHRSSISLLAESTDKQYYFISLSLLTTIAFGICERHSVACMPLLFQRIPLIQRFCSQDCILAELFPYFTIPMLNWYDCHSPYIQTVLGQNQIHELHTMMCLFSFHLPVFCHLYYRLSANQRHMLFTNPIHLSLFLHYLIDSTSTDVFRILNFLQHDQPFVHDYIQNMSYTEWITLFTKACLGDQYLWMEWLWTSYSPYVIQYSKEGTLLSTLLTNSSSTWVQRGWQLAEQHCHVTAFSEALMFTRLSWYAASPTSYHWPFLLSVVSKQHLQSYMKWYMTQTLMARNMPSFQILWKYWRCQIIEFSIQDIQDRDREQLNKWEDLLITKDDVEMWIHFRGLCRDNENITTHTLHTCLHARAESILSYILLHYEEVGYLIHTDYVDTYHHTAWDELSNDQQCQRMKSFLYWIVPPSLHLSIHGKEWWLEYRYCKDGRREEKLTFYKDD